MKNLPLMFLLLLSSASFAGQEYGCDIGQYGDGSKPDVGFILDIHHDSLVATEVLGGNYGRKVAWEELKETTTNGVTQTLYSRTDPDDRETSTRTMTVIQGDVKNSIEVHTLETSFFVDSIGQVQQKYGIEYYPRFYFTKCFSTQ